MKTIKNKNIKNKDYKKIEILKIKKRIFLQTSSRK